MSPPPAPADPARAAEGLSARIADIVGLDPSKPAVEFESRWRTWGELGSTIDAVAAHVPEPGFEVGVLLRNRPASVGFLLGVLRAGGCVVTINPQRGVGRTRADIDSLDLPLLAGEPADLDAHVDDRSRPATLRTGDLGEPVVATSAAERTAARRRPGVAVRMLTSGTTGPPKRIDLTYATLERVLVGAKHYESDRDDALRLRSGVAIVNSPLVHLGGLFRVLQCVNDGRSFSLLERFTVDGWLDAVRRHRPRTVSLVPAALRMVLDADVDPADLASVRSVVSGTAPLAPEDADAFAEKYGIPVLVSYAATEFGGGVAGWNLADHQRYWATKRGSVGRAHAGCELRVVDPESGSPLPAGAEGLLEVKAAQLGDDSWIRTTDLARLDGDGFLWILGRADETIIRGGFKVRPDDVRTTLERHPGVRGAAVVGIADARLGSVPVAAVELRPGAEATTTEALLEYAAAHLARYELPTEVRIVDELPRTDSAKVDLAAVRALFTHPDASAPNQSASVPKSLEEEGMSTDAEGVRG
ncbi:MAG TPA: AMP-binding protein [Acidimicrobiia bacterium]|nr:AMP-binding protein [Acidimicrobiia bacterium]